LSHPASDAVPAWPVLVVSTDAAHVAEVQRALLGWPVPVTTSVATNAMAAMRQALAQPWRLVVVDWGIDGPGGQALVRQLARLRPTLPVLAFDALGISGPAEQVLAWPWDELTTVLDFWLLQLLVDDRGSTTE
jgi:DNA-binding response OmpR family regulator